MGLQEFGPQTNLRGGAMASNHADDRFSGFSDILSSPDDLTTILGEPAPRVIAKVTDRLDQICRDFIAKSPFCIIGTTQPDGPIDLSPKGDPEGFVHVLDDKHLAIPDRPGNRRADTFNNLIADPRVGLIFLIPGKGETLRITGEARVVRDMAVREQMAEQGKVPELAMIVYVERILMHCPKCIRRSNIWQPEAWPDSSDTANIAEAVATHAKLNMTPEEIADYEARTRAAPLY